LLWAASTSCFHIILQFAANICGPSSASPILFNLGLVAGVYALRRQNPTLHGIGNDTAQGLTAEVVGAFHAGLDFSRYACVHPEGLFYPNEGFSVLDSWAQTARVTGGSGIPLGESLRGARERFKLHSSKKNFEYRRWSFTGGSTLATLP